MLSVEKNKIKYLHFIMSVLVILIHSINNETRFERFFSLESGIGQFAVPLFFIISGFLFFRNIKSMEDAKAKLRKRVNTILIPYLLWNLIYYMVYLLMKPGSGINFNEIFDAVFSYKYNPSFWFMNQLILLSVISPLIYYVINIRINNFPKRKSMIITAVAICIIAELAVVYGKDIPYINEDAFIYYCAGMILALLYIDGKVLLINKINTLKYFIILVLAFILNRFLVRRVALNPSFYNLFVSSIILVRLFGALVLFYFFDLFFNYRKVPKFMSPTFFLYAIHYMIVRAVIVVAESTIYKLIPIGINISGIELKTLIECLIFILSPIICIIINYYLSEFLIKNFKKQYSILVGYRV